MARATSGYITINIAASGGGGGITGVPASGAAKLVYASGGHQTPTNGRPSTHTAKMWTEALFEAFGSGSFNPSYSTDGAFVIAGSGGHGHSEIRGGAIFDFTTRSWIYVAPVGVSETSTYTKDDLDTNGTPWFELTGTEVPHPPHPYRNLCYIPTVNGGGTKGSMIYVTRAALDWTGIGKTSPTAHKFNCATGAWSRAAAATGPTAYMESTSVFDPVSNRYYVIPSEMHTFTSLPYLDGADWTWKTTSPAYSFPDTTGVSGYSHTSLYDGNSKRLLINFWGSRIHALDLSAVGSGFQNIPYTGTLPSTHEFTWVQHPTNGKLYARGISGQGQVLYRLTPPASPLGGSNWVIDTVTLTGDTVPEFTGGDVGGTVMSYKSLFAIPSLGMLGWVTNQGVALLNPT